jgi:hypothetical protein
MVSGSRMRNRMQFAVIVIAAMLFGFISSVSCDPAVAAPVARTTGVTPGLPAEAVTPLRARVYLFRGALGLIFSRGMDALTKRLQQHGIRADVYEFTICRLIAEQAIRDYRDDPVPITLIGHSMGGLCVLTFADILRSANIPVSLVVTIDPAHASPNVPLNVEHYINIFLSTSILGGGDVVAQPGYQGRYTSIDLKDREGVTHINIDKMDTIHAQLVTAIMHLATTPSTGSDAMVPLRYVIPPDSPLELWDGGTPQLVHSGDTLPRLAALNQVPLWSLVQANHLPENAMLAPGQSVVVPHRLTPLMAAPGLLPKRRISSARGISRAAGMESASEHAGDTIRRHPRPAPR